MAISDEVYRVNVDGGYYNFKLYKAIHDKGISHNQFMRDTETAYTVMRRYARGIIQRIDVVLIAKWCKYLDCEFVDIVEYCKE